MKQVHNPDIIQIGGFDDIGELTDLGVDSPPISDLGAFGLPSMASIQSTVKEDIKLLKWGLGGAAIGFIIGLITIPAITIAFPAVKIIK